MTAPLAGIRVVDLTNALAGASATKLLAEMGAEVLKIEAPACGDFTRDLVPFVFESFNRGKRSVAIDLKRPEGVELVRRMLPTADVFVHSMRPGAVEGLGLSYAEVKAINPSIIYASFSAFGVSGPGSHRRGVDAVVQAESGMANAQGRILDNLSFVDTASGMALSYAILAALLRRERTGIADHVHTNLLDVALYMQTVTISEFSVLRTEVDQAEFYRRFPLVGIFESADGPFYMGAYDQREWQSICDLLPALRLAEDDRFVDSVGRAANVAALRETLQTSFGRESRSSLVAGLEKGGVLAGEVHSYADVLADPQVAANGSLETVQLPGGETASMPRIPLQFASSGRGPTEPAPRLGAHTRGVLGSIGYSEAELDLLADSAVIGS